MASGLFLAWILCEVGCFRLKPGVKWAVAGLNRCEVGCFRLGLGVKWAVAGLSRGEVGCFWLGLGVKWAVFGLNRGEVGYFWLARGLTPIKVDIESNKAGCFIGVVRKRKSLNVNNPL